VLLVDDELGIVRSLQMLLSDEFHVVATSSPGQAWAWLTRGQWYDVILCDVVMPAMNGVELHERVHAVHPELAARFVFVTGGVRDALTQRRLEALPNLVLEKPMDFGALRELIRRRVYVAPGRLAGIS
jgi:DNA-binding NtrC family response regulator